MLNCACLCPKASRALSETLVSPTVKESVEGWRNQVDSPPEDSSHQLRRRRVKGYVLNSDDEAGPSSRESSCPPTPRDNYFPTLEDVHKQEKFEEDAICVEQSEGVWSLSAPMSLPRYVDQISVQNTLSLAETIADMLGPYRDLQEATLDSDYEKILGRLLTEWYVVGASVSVYTQHLHSSHSYDVTLRIAPSFSWVSGFWSLWSHAIS